MDWEFCTKIVLLCVTLFLILYDFVAYYCGGGKATISQVLLNSASEYPVIAFLLGIIVGHIFWKN